MSCDNKAAYRVYGTYRDGRLARDSSVYFSVLGAAVRVRALRESGVWAWYQDYNEPAPPSDGRANLKITGTPGGKA